jgi:hypothetical protein
MNAKSPMAAYWELWADSSAQVFDAHMKIMETVMPGYREAFWRAADGFAMNIQDMAVSAGQIRTRMSDSTSHPMTTTISRSPSARILDAE